MPTTTTTKKAVVKNIMHKLEEKKLMNPTLENFFEDELNKSFKGLAIHEESDKTEKPKRKLSVHNQKVSENIPIIRERCEAISARDAFSVAAMMSRIERTSEKFVTKNAALLLAACEANRAYNRVVVPCKCVKCKKL